MTPRMTAAWPGVTVLALAILAGPAQASLRTVEAAFELHAGQVHLPGSASAQVVVRRCPACPVIALQVTPATTWYMAPGARTPEAQAEVLEAAERAAGKPGTMIHVYYDPQSRRVTRIVLDPAPGAPR